VSAVGLFTLDLQADPAARIAVAGVAVEAAACART
jgi:hypothetical protein